MLSDPERALCAWEVYDQEAKERRPASPIIKRYICRVLPLFGLMVATALLILGTNIGRAQPAKAQTAPMPPPASPLPKAKIARAPSPSEELNTLLMHATFLISGPATIQGTTTFGTIFAMGIPFKNNPKIAHIVVVTAAHVLEGISGDFAFVKLRRKNNDGAYSPFLYQLRIRKSGQPLYVRHPTADVAAMYANLPDDVPMTGLTSDALVTDERLESIEIHPGDNAFVLGFPLAVSAPGGFPVLRVGHIASYPLTPMRLVKQWEFDLKLFGGNSGGPVYFSYVNRLFKKHVHLGLVQGILGLVIQEQHSIFPQFANKELDYGVVVPAQYIRETLDMLPPPPDEPTGSVK